MNSEQGKICVVDSTFDVALWFADKALEQNEYLQPQKLHRLLYLAQGYYSAAFEGHKLMPAVFVAEEMGPVEPNVYKVFAKGRPNIESENIFSEGVEQFLSSIWERFGRKTPDSLSEMCMKNHAFKQALINGVRSEIPFKQMLISFTRERGHPLSTQAKKPKMMRSQSGRPVAVKNWVPGS